MANITITVDDTLKRRMDQHPEINWSAVARASIEGKVEDLELLDRLTADSELTEEDVEFVARKVDERVASRLAR